MAIQDCNRKITVGIGQMHICGGDANENIENAIYFIKNAAQQGSSIIVLPECLDFGWTNSQAIKGAETIPGFYSDKLCLAAEENEIFVVAGLTERFEDKLYNTAILISNKGEIVGKHRKINILEIAQHLYSKGRSCVVFDTELCRIGLSICADNFPEYGAIAETLGLMGAQIILSPCSWAVPPDYKQEQEPYGDLWIKSYSEIAKKFQIPVIGVSNTGLLEDGAWKGWWCIGASLVVSSNGNVQKQFEFSREGNQLYQIEVELP